MTTRMMSVGASSSQPVAAMRMRMRRFGVRHGDARGARTSRDGRAAAGDGRQLLAVAELGQLGLGGGRPLSSASSGVIWPVIAS